MIAARRATGLVAVFLCSASAALAQPSGSARPPGAVDPAPPGGPPSSAGGLGLGRPVAWPAGDGVSVRLPLPPGAAALKEDSLPVVDLSSLPDSKVVLRRGVARADGSSGPDHVSDSVYAICIRAPGSHLPAEMEPLVFDRLNSAARSELAKAGTVTRFDEGVATEKDLHAEASYSAEANLGPGVGAASVKLKQRMEGRHVIGFVGDAADVLICSLACVEFSTESARLCPALLAGATVDAPFVSPPKPSLPSRLAFAAVRHPLSALGLFAGVLLMLAGGLLAAWPARKPAQPA